MKKLLVLLVVLSMVVPAIAQKSKDLPYKIMEFSVVGLGLYETAQTRYALTHYNVVELNPRMKWLMETDFRAYSFAIAENAALYLGFEWLKKKNKALGYVVMGAFFIARSYCIIRNAKTLANASSK